MSNDLFLNVNGQLVPVTKVAGFIAEAQTDNGTVWRPARDLVRGRDVAETTGVHKVVTTSTAPSATTATGAPKQLISVSATESPSKQQDRTFSQVSVSFTRDATDKSFAGVHVWFTGYKGNTNPVEMTDGTDSPITFLSETTGETVTVTVQPFGSDGTPADFSKALTTTVALDGVVSAPPAPSVTQSATSIPLGVQFTFTQLSAQLADVIDSYKVYRNTVNNSGTATVIQTVANNPANNGGPVVVQDHQAVGNTFYYWVSAVNTMGLESSVTSAGSIVIPAASLDSDVADGSIFLRGFKGSAATAPLANPDFEQGSGVLGDGNSGWFQQTSLGAVGTQAYDTVTLNTGLRSAKISKTGGVGAFNSIQNNVLGVCLPGDQVYIQLYGKTDGTAMLFGGLRWFDKNGSTVSVTRPVDGGGTSSWTFYSGTYTAPANALTYALEIGITGGSANGSVWFDNCYWRKVASLDTEVADGTSYLRNPQYSSTELIVENGNFEASSSANPVPGWNAVGSTLSYETASPQSGSQSLKVAAAAQFGAAISNRKYALRTGDVIKVSGYVNNYGTASAADIQLEFLDKNGTYLSGIQLTDGTADSNWHFVSGSGSVPANAVTGIFSLQCQTVAGGTVGFDNVQAFRVRSLDDEVSDGSTYGKVRLIALTNGSVDPSLTGMLMKGVLPPIFANGFTYTATTTSITISWNANQAIYRPDGTITQIPAGSQTITGLTTNVTYYFYAYWDEASSSLKWIGNSDVTYPSVVGATFNGTNQEVTTATQFALASTFTLEAWFKLTSAAANNLGIVTHGSGQTGNFVGSEAGIYINTGKVNCYIQNTVPATISIASTTTFNDGQWHHIVMTLSSGVMTVYADGTQMAQNSSAGSISATSAWLRLARGNTNSFFPGTISRVAYYNTALNLQQINNHYEAGNTLSFATYDTTVANDSPVYYWKLTDTSGTTAVNTQGVNNGTYVNAPTLNQSSAVFGADGSPAIAWSSDTLLNNQAQYNQARVPLTPGALTFATPSSGTSGGGGGGSGSGGSGGGSRSCFTPNTKVKTKRGNVAIVDLAPELDKVLTAKGTWNIVKEVTSRQYIGPMLDMGDDELSTPTHLTLLPNEQWKPMAKAHPEFPIVQYEGTIHNVLLCAAADDDGSQRDTERSYTLANGLVVHNPLT